MRIKDFHVENYRSLRDITLSNLGSLNILLGRNGTGKSNVIEALNLFFTEYSNIGGTTQGLNDYFWHKGSTKTPILFRVTMLLTHEELERVFDKQIVGRVKESSGEKYNIIEIQRSIINPQGNWTTDYMKWAGVPIIENDQARPFKGPGQSTHPKVLTSGSEQALAPIIAGEDRFTGVQNDLPQLLKTSFKLLTVIRDGRNADRFRVTLTDDDVQKQVWTLDQAIMSPDEEKYSMFESAFEGLTGMRMDPAQGKLMVRKEMRRFPLGLEGGGVQTSANLLYDMLVRGGQNSIFAIEEPETHVHPELQRKLSREFGKLARERQVFVATHSPFFLSMEEESRIWLLRLTGNETKVIPIPTEKLRTNPGEINLRPSDLLFSNKVVLVEGKSDRIILEAFAERLGIDLMNIELVPIHGKSRSSGTLEAWIGLMKNILPVYFILDPESQSELNEAISKGLTDKASAHVWRAGSIEKYYPLAILSESLDELNKRYSLGLDIGKVMKKIQSRDIQPDKIEIGSSKRERLDDSWDVLLAEEVAKRIWSGSGEVADEVMEALTNASALPPRE